MRNVKAPDFLSRLKASLDISSVNPDMPESFAEMLNHLLKMYTDLCLKQQFSELADILFQSEAFLDHVKSINNLKLNEYSYERETVLKVRELCRKLIHILLVNLILNRYENMKMFFPECYLARQRN